MKPKYRYRVYCETYDGRFLSESFTSMRKAKKAISGLNNVNRMIKNSSKYFEHKYIPAYTNIQLKKMRLLYDLY